MSPTLQRGRASRTSKRTAKRSTHSTPFRKPLSSSASQGAFRPLRMIYSENCLFIQASQRVGEVVKWRFIGMFPMFLSDPKMAGILSTVLKCQYSDKKVDDFGPLKKV